MGQIVSTFDGGVVAVPELKEFSSGASVLEFPVYVNHRKKNKDTQEYEDTGDVSKIKVKVWSGSPLYADALEVMKGDIVEIKGTIIERNYTTKAGIAGRALETDWIESITTKYRNPNPAAAPSGGSGFDSAVPSGF